MRIAPVGMPTAGSPSCEGLIDGRARGHWRDRASFPAAGDGGVLFIIYVDLRRLCNLHVPKPCISVLPSLVGENPVAQLCNVDSVEVAVVKKDPNAKMLKRSGRLP